MCDHTSDVLQTYNVEQQKYTGFVALCCVCEWKHSSRDYIEVVDAARNHFVESLDI